MYEEHVRHFGPYFQSKDTRSLFSTWLNHNQSYQTPNAHAWSPRYRSNTPIYSYNPKRAESYYLLSLLCVGAHLFAKGKIRHFETGQGPDADEEDEEEGDDGGETHEESRCKVLVAFK